MQLSPRLTVCLTKNIFIAITAMANLFCVAEVKSGLLTKWWTGWIAHSIILTHTAI